MSLNNIIVVDRDEDHHWLVSTVRIPRILPLNNSFTCPPEYETAIAHPDFEEGNITVVATNYTWKQAQKGHNIWANRIWLNKIPKNIDDISLPFWIRLLNLLSG